MSGSKGAEALFREELLRELETDCGNCRGLCCTVLCFSRSEGFPVDKEAGVPCVFLQPDFRCGVHAELKERGLRGCMAYDCLGTGRKVTHAVSGAAPPGNAAPEPGLMCGLFGVVFQLHQMLWYLAEADELTAPGTRRDEIRTLIGENRRVTDLPPEELITLDMGEYRHRVNSILKETWETAARETAGKFRKSRGFEYIGRDFRGQDLRGRDFGGALLIAADFRCCDLCGVNFLGADLRDARLEDANLSASVFLTPMQLSSARGNRGTALPARLSAPGMWLE